MSHLIQLTNASDRSERTYIEIVGDKTDISDVYIEGNMFSLSYIIKEIGQCIGWENVRYINYWKNDNFLHLQVINKNFKKNIYKIIRDYIKDASKRCHIWLFNFKSIK